MNFGIYIQKGNRGDKKPKTKKKTFLTEFKLPDGKYGWEIKAYDWEEAEEICKRIKHKLNGEKVKV